MNLDAFSTEQVNSLLELLVLGMYVDGHLADAEDQNIKYYAQEAGLRAGYNTEQALDRTITAVRKIPRDEAGLRGAVERIATVLDDEDSRAKAITALNSIHASDADHAPTEHSFQKLVLEVFEL